MMEAATKKLNINPYITVYSSLLGVKRNLTLDTILVCGEFASFSGKKEDNGSLSDCTRRKSTLAEITRTSRATVYRAMKELTGKELEAVEGKPDTFVFKHGEDDDIFIRIDKRLISKKFDIFDEDTKQIIERRYLTPAEIFIAGLIITRCDNKKHKKKIYETTNKEIADELGISESTVAPAIKVLKGAKIIVRKSEDVGINRYVKSKYSINRKFKRNYKIVSDTKGVNQNVTSGARDTESKSKYIPFSDFEAARREQIVNRERAFYEAKHAAEETADRNYRRARLDEQFRKADDDLTAISIEIAKAEAIASDGKATDDLYKREAELQRQRTAALERLGLSESSLTVPDKYRGDARGSPSPESV